MKWVENKINKMRKYVLNITPQDFDVTKQLFDILNVPWYIAPLEAETMCACLCKRGLVDAVLSEDTDVLAYGAPIFLSKINTTHETFTYINYQELLEQLELSSESFLDLCIMCGTDYNKNIYMIGPEKSYTMIKTHENIDNISTNTSLDVSILNHKRGRELFRIYEKHSVENISFCGIPDFNKLKEFMFKYNIALDIDGIKSSFIENKVVFEE
jgi:5'-3' exonuclease